MSQPEPPDPEKGPSPVSGASSISDRKQESFFRRSYNLLLFTPPYLRHDPTKPERFSWALVFLFGFAGTFTVANLYYSHPILNLLARDFHVTNERASLVPTLAQAGYAGGLLFLCPLGDLVERRPFVVGLVGFTGIMWLGLCLTNDFGVFLAFSFITGFTTVTPQISEQALSFQSLNLC